MAKRENYYKVKCTHEGCNEVGIYNYSSQRELKQLCEKYNKNWTCVRHSDPEEVLSIDNKITTEVLIVKKHNGFNYWQKEKNIGTEKLQSGFQYGNGYKAYANDFEEGTKLIITAELKTN